MNKTKMFAVIALFLTVVGCQPKDAQALEVQNEVTQPTPTVETTEDHVPEPTPGEEATAFSKAMDDVKARWHSLGCTMGWAEDCPNPEEAETETAADKAE